MRVEGRRKREEGRDVSYICVIQAITFVGYCGLNVTLLTVLRKRDTSTA